MSFKQVLLGATITLSATLVGALTACIIVAVKQRSTREPQVSPPLLGGQRVALVVNHVGDTPLSSKLLRRMSVPGDKYIVRVGGGGPVLPGWREMQVQPSVSPWVVKWLVPFVSREYTTVVVTNGDSKSLRAAQEYLRLWSTGTAPTAPIVYEQPVSNNAGLLQFVNKQRSRVGTEWAAFLRENVHPAWWLSLLVPDLNVVVHNRGARSREARAKCEVMLRLMHAHHLPNDRSVFGYIFSPLSVLASSW
jgi:hypothetical protein